MSGRLRLGEERRDRALSVRLDRTLRIIREVYRGEASACDLDADPPALASAFEFPGPADVDVGAVGSSVILSGSREDLPGLVGQAWSWEDEPHPGGVRLDRVGERIGLLERRAGGVEVAEVDRRGVARAKSRVRISGSQRPLTVSARRLSGGRSSNQVRRLTLVPPNRISRNALDSKSHRNQSDLSDSRPDISRVWREPPGLGSTERRLPLSEPPSLARSLVRTVARNSPPTYRGRFAKLRQLARISPT